MSVNPEFVPAYVSPLTDKEHACIGRIAVLWGQIENSLDSLLPLVSGVTWESLTTIGVTGKNVQAKTGFLKSVAKLMSDDDRRKRVGLFCEQIENTKTARNHLFHGMWGWRADPRTQSVVAWARHPKYPTTPLKSENLSRLERELCKCSRLGINLLYEFWGWSESGAARFFHGGEKDFPEWLRQWTERNPLDQTSLDQDAKAGQLPRLARAFPRK